MDGCEEAMLWVVVAIGLLFILLERARPDRKLPAVPGFVARALVLNLAQLGVVVLAGRTWDAWLRGASVFELGQRGWPVPVEGLLGYIVASFVYYWWHRARHDVDWLWRLCHQVHHSPQRIETLTAFYKHPAELLLNSLLSSLVSYPLCGQSIEGAAFTTLLSGVAEFVYHVNVRTPRALGYFLQRPEMHRLHHRRSVHYDNFSDLPLWDMLFGTYQNPETYTGPCGFRPEREARFVDMLLLENVNGPRPSGARRGARSGKA